MISVQNDSNFLNICEIGKELGISILAISQKGMSDHFAGMTQSDNPIAFKSHNKCHTLHDSLAWYETSIKEIIEAGDHHLILCHVHNLERNQNALPLLYYSGYKTLGEDL